MIVFRWSMTFWHNGSRHLIDAEPYLGYRMVWARLRRQDLKVSRKAVQRIMQIKGWQCHRRV
jgi:hypothetical protein